MIRKKKVEDFQTKNLPYGSLDIYFWNRMYLIGLVDDYLSLSSEKKGGRTVAFLVTRESMNLQWTRMIVIVWYFSFKSFHLEFSTRTNVGLQLLLSRSFSPSHVPFRRRDVVSRFFLIGTTKVSNTVNMQCPIY